MQELVCFAVQQRHDLLPHSPGAATVIKLPEVDDLLGEDLHVGRADPSTSGAGSGLGWRHREGHSAGSANAAALNTEPSRSLRRRMSRPDNSTTVRTVPSSVPAPVSPSWGLSSGGVRSANPHSVTVNSRRSRLLFLL